MSLDGAGAPREATRKRLTTGLDAYSISIADDGRTLAYDRMIVRQNIYAIPIPASGVASVRDARPISVRALRVLADESAVRRRFLVLGSASPALLRQGAESLAGRIAYHELHGFRLDEVGVPLLSKRWMRDTSFSDIRSKAGLQETSETPVRLMLDKLQQLDYVGAKRNIGAKHTSPYHYHISDPAFAFYYHFTARHETALARNAPLHVWNTYMREHFDSYIGHIFEWIAEQAYARFTGSLSLPAVAEWGRWEGQDRARQSLEMDIVAPLVDGRILTGGVKWNAQPLDAKWHYHHMQMLERLRQAGVPWAHEAATPHAPILWVAAGGFTDEFRAAVHCDRAEVYLWSLEDLYREHGDHGRQHSR